MKRLVPPPKHLETIREAAESAKQRDGIRPTARAIGISHSGLKVFLQGSYPYTPTMRKLERWYLRYLRTLGEIAEA